MDLLPIVIFFSLIGSVVSLAGGALLLSKHTFADKLARYATPFAAGALLAAVFLDLLPEGIAEDEPSVVLIWALAGILLFFFLERFLTWFHHHHEHQYSEHQASKSLIVIGDTIHNALDGVAIAAAFMVSVPVGIVTTFAIAAHEIPQEIGDFGLLLSKGMSRRRVLSVSLLSALATTVAAVATILIGNATSIPIGPLLGISAGFLLYIAMSDVIPTIHEQIPKKRLFDVRPALLLLGTFVVALTIMVAERFIDG